MIGVWDIGDAGEEGLVEVGMAGDVGSGWQLVVCLEAVHEEVRGGESPLLGGRSLVGEHQSLLLLLLQ